jgi:hypothetical protein
VIFFDAKKLEDGFGAINQIEDSPGAAHSSQSKQLVYKQKYAYVRD